MKFCIGELVPGGSSNRRNKDKSSLTQESNTFFSKTWENFFCRMNCFDFDSGGYFFSAGLMARVTTVMKYFEIETLFFSRHLAVVDLFMKYFEFRSRGEKGGGRVRYIFKVPVLLKGLPPTLVPRVWIVVPYLT